MVQRLDASTQSLADRWGQALAQQQRSSEALSEGLKTSVTELVNGFTQRSSALLTTVQQTHVALQADLASGDQQRLAAWSTSLQAMAQSLHGDAQRAAEQAEQCLKNIEAALAQAGSGLVDVVRVTYVLPDASEFEACWPVLRRCFGEVRPAAMMISAGLADPRMKIEIEVTALKRSESP